MASSRPTKRYILFEAESELGEEDLKTLSAELASRGWRAKVIAVEGSPRSAIVRTDGDVASQIRAQGGRISVGGLVLASLLTSGAVGNLKRRAREGVEHGQVHE